MVTLADYTKRIFRPRILSGIRAGKLDAVLADWLIECPPDDDEILVAVLDRLKIILAHPRQSATTIFDWVGNAKIGAQLRVRLPSDAI